MYCPGDPSSGSGDFHAIDAEAKSEVLIGTDLSQLILGHQFDRFAADQTRVPDLAAIQHHLAEARVVGRGGVEAGAARI